MFSFSVALRPNAGHGLLILEVFQITHNDASQSVGLLWTSDQLVAETSTLQHTTLTTDKHPCPRWDSNPRSQQASGRTPTPQTAGLLGPVYTIYTLCVSCIYTIYTVFEQCTLFVRYIYILYIQTVHNLDDWLTVHRSIILVDFQIDALNSYLFTYNTFIKILYMFRALTCSSSGGLRRNCIYAASGIVTLCR